MRDETPAQFTDLDGHWAEAYILRAYNMGWLSGRGDGAFQPDAPVTRTEVVSALNRMTRWWLWGATIYYMSEYYSEGTWMFPDLANLWVATDFLEAASETHDFYLFKDEDTRIGSSFNYYEEKREASQ